MSVRDDLLNIKQIPPEYFWKPKELEKRNKEIGLIIQRIKPSHEICKKLIELTDYIQKKDLKKANKMIDDITSQVRKMNPAQIQDLEQIVQATQKKTSGWKKAVAYGMTILTLGMYAPTTADAGGQAIINNKVTNIYGQGGTFGYTGDGRIVNSGAIHDSEGNFVFRHTESITIDPELLKQDKSNTQTYASELDRLNAAIKQNPTNASLYIQKMDELIKTKSPPQEIIKVGETALKQKVLEGTNSDISRIYRGLGNEYQEINPQKSIFYYKKIPSFGQNPEQRDLIKYLEKKIK